MDVTRDNVEDFFQGLETRFRAGMSKVQPFYKRFCTPTTSTTAQELYRWLAQLPQAREWIGQRVIHNVETEGFTVVNKTYEDTISVDRDDVKDDHLGMYGPMAAQMGRVIARHPDKLAAELLNDNTALGYDGKALLATDHPVGSSTASNFDNGGASKRWYLIEGDHELLPLIFQEREGLELQSITDPQHPYVFEHNKFVFGARFRYAMAPGFWQSIYASNQALDATNFENAFEAMGELKDANDEPLGLKPTILMVPMSLRAQALEIVQAERDASGATNINRNAVSEVIVNPWLTA